ncbi:MULTISPECIES: TRAP transporter small permease [unclassified Marinovum]
MLSTMDRLARVTALMGGLVLSALVVLTCVSVLGRGLNTLGHSSVLSEALGAALIGWGVGPVSGDFELVEAGIAFAIFSFLPYCQLHGGHATVDIFTQALPRRANAWLMAFWEVVLTLVIWLITVRLFAGMMSKLGNGETTFLLQFPVWWAYAASFVAAVVASIVAGYCAYGRVMMAATGKRLMPKSEGAAH